MFARIMIAGALLGGAAFLAAPDRVWAHIPNLENGDFNGDYERDITDVVCMVNWLFLGGPGCAPLECFDYPGSPASEPSLENGDANADKNVDVADLVYILQYLYLGGPEPATVECLQVYVPPEE